MEYFKKYTSNSNAASGNQLIFYSDSPDEIMTGRAFFKIANSGKYNYSFLYSNILDSTFGDGSVGHCNKIVDQWTIHHISVAKCKNCYMDKMTDEFTTDFIQLTINGEKSKIVAPGEFFSTDPVEIDAEKDEYLCIEISFSGNELPYHEETILPMYRKVDNNWEFSVKMPVPSMIGCDRKVKKKIAFIGDSITQGEGTPKNEYLHYTAFIAEKSNPENAYWNIAFGYGRAYDASTDGSWLFRAKQNDFITVCFGVNDILQGYSADEICESLRKTVSYLKKKNMTVVLQTVPPFDYNEERTKTWNTVNNYINTELAKMVDGVFDTVNILSAGGDTPEKTVYGSHPNEIGHKIWGDKLYEYLKENFKEIF